MFERHLVHRFAGVPKKKSASGLFLDLGAGNDELRVTNSYTQAYWVLLGSGDDLLTDFFDVNVAAISSGSYFDGGIGHRSLETAAHLAVFLRCTRVRGD